MGAAVLLAAAVLVASYGQRRAAAARAQTAPTLLPAASAAPSERDTPSGTPLLDGKKTELQASWSQARGAWFSAVVGAVALAASLIALVGQVRINDQQIGLNRQTALHTAQEHAARVAIWHTDGRYSDSRVPKGIDVFVQNMSPAALFDIRILAATDSGAGAGDAELDIGTIPPCTTVRVRAAAPALQHLRRVTTGSASSVPLKLYFTETNRTWYATGGTLVLKSNDNADWFPPSESFPHLRSGGGVHATQAPGCG
ncbi:hypothetical protein JIG36_48695 [Actinoplanes sp. LDG1-06]|uniref:Uncharacterized protein n=1 Tax=Paractinoplanes ovalisporus TaxID=2810368 RepID=A0ABS2AUA5_9ACTN|nr:hypothetical protein [Actinoplanes ovalisporus]MBM2623401.1 hypothetical protein [Actinoplanes ovalisporus]